MNQTSMKDVALYGRVSSKRQEQEDTIASQLAELRAAIAERSDISTCKEFIDEAYGRDTLARPSLDELRDLASTGEITEVFVQAPDRLASGTNLMVLYDEFKASGCKVTFLKGAAEDTPEGKLQLHLLGAIGEYERTKTDERTRRGKLHWSRQGFLVGGAKPYGYEFVKRTESDRATLRIDPFQSGIIKEMFRLLVEEGMSTRSITKILNERGIPTARGGSQWKPTTVSNMLKNPAYRGDFVYQKTRSAEPTFRIRDDQYNNRKTGRRPRPTEEHIHVPVPLIVDEETWYAAQTQLKRNSRNAGRNNKRHSYLLKGLIKCPRCGGRYTGAASKSRRRYRCTNQDGVVSGEHRKCSPGSMRADPLEGAVWDALVSSLRRPDLIETEYNRRMSAENAGSGTELEIKRLKRMIDDIRRREKRLLDAYVAEALVLDLYKSESEKVRTGRTEIERQLNHLEHARNQAIQQSAEVAGIKEFCDKISSGIDRLDPDGRRRLVELLVEQIDLESDDKIRIHLVIPPHSPSNVELGELRQRHPEHPGGVHMIEDEGRAVKELFERYARGNATTASLAIWLNEQGFRTRNTKRLPTPDGAETTGPRFFTNASVRVILHNPFYSGMVRHKKETFPGQHEPVISTELFETVDLALRKNSGGASTIGRI